MIAVLLVYAEDETTDSQISLGSKECRRAETERRSDVKVVSPNTGCVSGSRKGNDWDASVLETHEDQSKRSDGVLHDKV